MLLHLSKSPATKAPMNTSAFLHPRISLLSSVWQVSISALIGCVWQHNTPTASEHREGRVAVTVAHHLPESRADHDERQAAVWLQADNEPGD